MSYSESGFIEGREVIYDIKCHRSNQNTLLQLVQILCKTNRTKWCSSKCAWIF